MNKERREQAVNTANIRKKLLALLMAAALLAGLSLSGYADIADPY